jgi:DNA-binding MarR family transcriptional regulator/GNAT superfamily N-acetyltransferase
MDATLVERVRRFNRVVTQRIGALDEGYLSRSRPLGQARLLWEIGPTGSTVRTLRSRLDLDSGYLSRLLRTLEAEGLVTVATDPGDGRVRTVRLTEAGRAERAELDRRSDELAGSILGPLSTDQRDRLVSAMATVERMLMASMVVVSALDPAHPAAQHCLRSYFAELSERFEAGFDPAVTRSPDLGPPHGLLLVATLHGEPVGCGGLAFNGPGSADLKRMWVSPAVRGLGLGRRLLDALESEAAARGVHELRLDTNRVLGEAIAMYRSAGYREVPAFNEEPYAHHWFAKDLGA